MQAEALALAPSHFLQEKCTHIVCCRQPVAVPVHQLCWRAGLRHAAAAKELAALGCAIAAAQQQDVGGLLHLDLGDRPQILVQIRLRDSGWGRSVPCGIPSGRCGARVGCIRELAAADQTCGDGVICKAISQRCCGGRRGSLGREWWLVDERTCELPRPLLELDLDLGRKEAGHGQTCFEDVVAESSVGLSKRAAAEPTTVWVTDSGAATSVSLAKVSGGGWVAR